MATVAALFALLAVAGLAARYLDQSVIPAYLLVGVLVGPHAPVIMGYSLALVPDAGSVRVLADLGVVLLLFFVGLELHLDSLLAAGPRLLRASAWNVGVALPLGFLLGLAFGFSVVESLVLAVITFNSSTVIVAKLLVELGWITSPEAEPILGVLVVEDVVVALLLALISALVLGESTGPLALGLSVALAGGFVAVGLVVARYATPYIERAFTVESEELFVLAVLAVATAMAALGPHAGVSAAVAAFLAGIAFGRTTLTERVERLLGPTRDLLAAAFFLVIGLETDPGLLLAPAVLLPALVVTAVTIPGQVVAGSLAGRAYGLPRDRAVRVGVALAPRGEFSLVIAAFVATAGTTAVLRDTIPPITVAYVILTSVLGTLMMRHAGVFETLADRLAETLAGPTTGEN